MRPTGLLLTSLLAGAPAAQTTRYRDPVFVQVQVQRNLAYGSALNRFTQITETLRLDLYEPLGDADPARPAMVIVHGGGFVGGDKGTSQMVQQGNDFARRGYVAVSINYRLAPSGTPIDRQVVTDAAHDTKAAIRWLRSQAQTLRLDSERIASVGSSAGGFSVLEAAYVPGEGQSGNPGWPSHVAAVVDQWGRLFDLNELQAGEVPVCIVHGTNDTTVPYANATLLKARADAVGVPAELHPIQGAGHAPWPVYFQGFQTEVFGFLWERLHLARLAGLQVRPGYASPGNLTLDASGVAGDLAVALLAASQANAPIPGLGVLWLDPATLLVVGTWTLPATPRVATAALSLPVPAGLLGATLYWQALQASATTGPRALTNCVPTIF